MGPPLCAGRGAGVVFTVQRLHTSLCSLGSSCEKRREEVQTLLASTQEHASFPELCLIRFLPHILAAQGFLPLSSDPSSDALATTTLTPLPAVNISINTNGKASTMGRKPNIKITYTSFTAVAEWKWDLPEEADDTCGICRVQFEGTCAKCKYPGDECPISMPTALHSRL